MAPPLRIAFLHPDLGLGGAERLVVDAAVALVKQGHQVTMYTSHYEPQRSFAETRDGSFEVKVAGDWLPRHFLGKFHILFAILRALWLAAVVAITGPKFDVYVCDQVSAYVPVLRLLAPSAGVLFYCHVPDQLLSSKGGWLKTLYRAPFNAWEEWTTGLSHSIVVNSGFTRGVFKSTFTSLARVQSEILYPCIDVDPKAKQAPPQSPPAGPVVLLSINRFDRKKDVGLAIRAFGLLQRRLPASTAARLHLVLAGGYDTRVAENVEHYKELQRVAQQEGLVPAGSGYTSDVSRVLPSFPCRPPDAPPLPYPQVENAGSVTFIRSFTDAQKAALLTAASAVIYTPSGEHFGIVPLECMAAYRPVIAVASGGPTESVVDGDTGFLCQPTPEAFCDAMAVIAQRPEQVQTMGRAGHRHVQGKFSRDAFGAHLHALCTALHEKMTRGAGRHARREL